MWIDKYIDSDGSELIVKNFCYEDKDYYNSNNRLHRLDGPASIFSSGRYFWYKEGEWHRIGGPAYFDGQYYEWYIFGKPVSIYYIYG